MKKLKRLFIVRTLRKIPVASAAAVAGIASIGSQAQAQTVIINDNFTSGSQYGNSAIGVAPAPVNLPGGVYSLEGSGFSDSREWTTTNPSNFQGGTGDYLSEHNGGATATSLGAYGGFGNVLSVSATLNPNVAPNTGLSGNAGNDAIVGFYSSAGTSTTASGDYAGPGTLNHFVGLQLDGAGDVSYVINGTVIPTGTNDGGNAISGGSSIFNSNGLTTLSFDISRDTASGYLTISDIMLGGVSYSNTYISEPVSASALDYVGLGAYGNATDGSRSIFTNLEVSTSSDLSGEPIPEPSTYALLASGALLLGAQQLRRRRNQV